MGSRTDGETTISTLPIFDFNHPATREPFGHGIDANRLQRAASILGIRPEDLSGALAAQRHTNTLSPQARSIIANNPFHHYGPSGSEQEYGSGPRTEVGGALGLELDLSSLFPELELGKAPGNTYDRVGSKTNTDIGLHWNSPIPQSSISSGGTLAPDHLLPPLSVTNESGIHDEPGSGLLPLPETTLHTDTPDYRDYGSGLVAQSLAASVHLDTGQEAPKQTPSKPSDASRGNENWHFETTATNLPPNALHTIMSGPCSKVWKIPPKPGRSLSKTTGQSSKRKWTDREERQRQQRVRGPFQDVVKQRETALVRRLNACIRCRMQRIRIVDAILFRDQKAPNVFYSRRWNSMEIQDITDWASENRKLIELSHGFGNAKYKLQLREFVPTDGDTLFEAWSDGPVLKKHFIPPFAIEDMNVTAKEIGRYVDSSIVECAIKIVGDADSLIWDTYQMAIKHMLQASREDHRGFLRNLLRLWLTSRMTSMAENICSNEKVGTVVDDPSSPYFGTVPVAPVICAQLEVITFSTLQRPLMNNVLRQLQTLIAANDRRNWFTIYLGLFILLHSCSLTSRRDEEYARQMLMQTRYANPESISAHQMSTKIILAHFHYGGKGSLPFLMANHPPEFKETIQAAELNPEQAQLIRNTADWVRRKRM
ncbi:MAG: hypothetical protein Q9221_007098 [Calogaya cf. arnoldii]